MITSGEIKTAVLGYFRFKRQMPYVATEVSRGMHWADVYVANREMSIEVEVKISRKDFRDDFNKHKHRYLDAHPTMWPNKFYYAVPKEMVAFVEEELTKMAKPFGVISYNGDPEVWVPQHHPWDRLSITRSAKWLHKEPPKPHVLEDLLLRMGSEIFGFHHATGENARLMEVVSMSLKDAAALKPDSADAEEIAEEGDHGRTPGEEGSAGPGAVGA